MGEYYLGIDQGTTFTTALLVDNGWNVVSKGSVEHKQIYPKPGWVEHNPVELFESVLLATSQALEKIHAKASDIRAIGIDHQGETCLVWDKETGQPVYNAIVWQDRRTSDKAEYLKKTYGEKILNITGMLPDAYPSATKLRWIIDNVKGVKDKADKGKLLAGTLDTWLIWKLTGGESFSTDACSAGRLMLMDSRKTQWDPWLIELIGIPESILPPIVDCNTIFGETHPDVFFGARIPIAGSLTDANASAIGSGSSDPNTLNTSYGTGSFMGLTTGEKFIVPNYGLTCSCAWRLSGKKTYKLLGVSYVAGSAMQWLRDGLRILDNVSDSEKMAGSVDDTNGVYFVPAFAGLATPYWNQFARGAFMGLTSAVTREHMVRAVLESVAYQTLNCFRVMENEFDDKILRMVAGGGMVDNGFLMQFQSDLLNIPIEIPVEKETAAFGAACMAGLTTGAFTTLTDVKQFVAMRKVYEPKMGRGEREKRFSHWKNAVERTLNWIPPDSKES